MDTLRLQVQASDGSWVVVQTTSDPMDLVDTLLRGPGTPAPRPTTWRVMADYIAYEEECERENQPIQLKPSRPPDVITTG